MPAPKPDPLFLTEAEIAQRVGVSPAEWTGTAVVLERHGLPAKDALFGRRYWPAVKAFLDHRAGLTGPAVPAQPDGLENFDDRPRGRDRSRPRAA